MKIARVNHIRCGEWSDTTYIWVPRDFQKKEFRAAITRAKSAYLEAEAKLAKLPHSSGWGHNSNYLPISGLEACEPGTTVADYLAQHARDEAARKEGDKERKRLRRSFAAYLIDEIEGAQQFYDEVRGLEADVDWGHLHGVVVEYGGNPGNVSGPTVGEVPDEDDEDYYYD